MKQIYCLRHAHALNGDGSGDRERRLSAQGQADAGALGRVMSERGYVPDLVLCSSAVRTRMTWAGVAEGLPDCKIQFEDILYSGSVPDYMDLLHEVSEEHDRVLVVGHNPTIHALAANLAVDDGSAFLSDIMSRYSPCTLSVFEVGGDHWSGLRARGNGLVDVVVGDGF